MVKQWSEEGYNYNKEFADTTQNGKKSTSSNTTVPSPEDNTDFSLNTVAQYIFSIGVVAAIGLLGYFYLRKYSTAQRTQIEIPKEDTIYNVDFDGGLSAMEAEGNYYQCVRLKYLALLRLLHDRKDINWMPNKTPTQYVYEMKQEHNFVQITNLFMRIRYGNYEATQQSYADACALYDAVRNRKKGGKA